MTIDTIVQETVTIELPVCRYDELRIGALFYPLDQQQGLLKESLILIKTEKPNSPDLYWGGRKQEWFEHPQHGWYIADHTACIVVHYGQPDLHKKK